jgi:hypothetical protein
LKLHTGAPGAGGTSNAATETTRQEVTWGSASGNALSNSTRPVWTDVAGTEDYTHVTAWSAESGGTFGFSGTITAASVTAGDTFRLPIGDVDLSFAALAS